LYEAIEGRFYREHPDFVSPGWSKPTYELNGLVPEGRLGTLANSKELLLETFGDQEIHVEKGTRLKGTRTGIHVHEAAGITFVMRGKGSITDAIQGEPNARYSVGEFYYMPANTPMAAANLSDYNVKLMDFFITPLGSPMMTVIEPGYPGYSPT
jgi:quercetin dioxygenase-like cupin family protein